jgi:4-aminobutyrate aminotransferase-like enzyme
MVPWPDTYRMPGGLTEDQAIDDYVSHVAEAIQDLQDSGVGLAGMMVCPIFANEGLPNNPQKYLQKAMKLVRDAGGLYLADEVQAGFGRTGRWWGHSDSGLTPDIVTLGKPMGAGHPLAGLVARGELIDEFLATEGYFNTFGGNPVSCAVGIAVMEVIEDEGLVENAAKVGAYVLDRFLALQGKYEMIGDVRGNGLFFGIDLVSDRDLKTPDAATAKYVVNTMRHKGIVMSKIGAHDNVLKLRPPLCFSEEHAALMISTLDKVLGELV